MAKKRRTVCGCCICIFTSVGSMFFSLWLTSLRAQPPKCYIQSLYVPSLNETLFHNNHNNTHSNDNNTIFFTLKLANANNDKGVRYDAVRVSFGVFVTNNATLPLANATLEGFYQGYGKTAMKSGSAEGRGGGVNRTVTEGGGGGRVFLRVEVATAVKYKTPVWYTKRHRLQGGANVEVSASSGKKVSPKGIRLGNVPARLGSGAAAEGRGAGILVCVLLTLCVYLG